MIDNHTIDRSNRIQIFVRDAMPGSWLAYSEELKESAEILWVEYSIGLRLNITQDTENILEKEKVSSISRSYLLLAGFALENVIKGILVADNPSHINSGKLSKELKSHLLSKLALKIKGLVITKDELKLLRLLEEVIPYWGRYPIPLEYNGVLPEVSVTLENRELFLEFHYKLGSFLHSKIKDGWDSMVGPKMIKARSAHYGDVLNKEEPFF